MHSARLVASMFVMFVVAGCESHYAELRSGEYAVVPPPDEGDTKTEAGGNAKGDAKAEAGSEAKADAVPVPAVTVKIDREATSITVTVDGTATTSKYTPRPREQWPMGCPMNMSSYREELADIEGPLTIGAMTLEKPTLLARCPDGAHVMLTEAQEYTGHDRPCPPESCIEFANQK
ncbi:MAG: hypothetical protein AAF799_18125 [Myxococcota bacterium]